MKDKKRVEWLGSTQKDIRKLPREVVIEIGNTLNAIQLGDKPSKIKALKGNGLKGVYEIKADFNKDTYRAVYVINLGDCIYMLHVFKKKSKKGISTPKADIDKIKLRLKEAKKEAKNEKGKS